MKAKHLLTIAGGATLLTAAVASAGNGDLSMEIVGNDLIPEHWTAHIYVELDTGWRLDAVYGNEPSPLTMTTSTSFYQNPFGGNTSKAINAALIGQFPSLAYDSWVTIGLETSDANEMSDQGINWSSFMGGGAISTDDGAWFVTPDHAQGDSIDGKVLIAQFTSFGMDSVLSGTVNLQGKDAKGDNWEILGRDYSFAKPAPGAIALLGLAGFAGRRRRRA